MVTIDRLTKLMHCESEIAWRDLLFQLARELGFDSVLFGLVVSKHAALETAVVHSNYARTWRDFYDQNKLCYVDPTVIHCISSRLPIIWKPEIFHDAQQAALYEEASQFGLRAGITLPIHGFNGEFGLISFATDQLPSATFHEHLRHNTGVLSLVRDYAFESSLKFGTSRSSDEIAPKLTQCELEMLKLLASGLQRSEIAHVLNLAEAKVDYYLSEIRYKFNVQTGQQAVVRAILLDLVTPDDIPIQKRPRQIWDAAS